jgi:DNA mismatch repair protein MutL
MKIDDLFNIKTLGFRGEALASISSVSEFEMITNDDENNEGTKISAEGSSQLTIEKVAASKGTTIIVKDLFFNTPARKKHLKLTTTELSKVVDIITRYAIANPLIYFKVEHNGKTILNSPNTASLFNNIVDIYGKDIAKELLEVDYADNHYTVRGYISKPTVSRIDKNNVSIYVNGRYVKNKVVTDALYDAYHTLLHNNRYPFAVLKITIDPKRLDVNIHPAKTKIKIEEEGKLYELVFDVVRKTLKGNNLIPDGDVKLQSMSQSVLSKPDGKSDEDIENPEIKASIQNNPITEPIVDNTPKVKANYERKYSIQEMKQASLAEINNNAADATFSGGNIEDVSVRESEVTPPKIDDKKDEQETLASKPVFYNTEIKQNVPEHSEGIKFFTLGQLYKTYILCETKEGLMIVDQHAAHERIIFERLMKDYVSENIIKKQALLAPVKLELNPRDKAILEEKKEIIKQLGFEFEDFGQGTYVLRSIPVVIGKQQEKTILLDILDELISFQRSKSIDEVKKKILSTIACRSAIKAGDDLTIDRMNSLLKELFACDFSSNCPHGRPTVINVTIEELEKRFKRSGF